MKKKTILHLSILCIIFCCLTFVNEKKAYAYDGETMEEAIPIGIDQTAMEFTKGGGYTIDETIFLKVTIPKDIGNRSISFHMSNYGDSKWYTMNMELLDSQGRSMRSAWAKNSFSTRILTQMEGSAGYSKNNVRLCAGSVYYLKIYPDNYGDEGKYYISVTSTVDDNWGTHNEAEKLVYNQKTYGCIEEWVDIDCFSAELPNDNKKYAFILSSDNNVKANLVDSEGEKLGSIQAGLNKDGKFSIVGMGQKIFVEIETNSTDNTISSADYSISYTEEKQKIATLKLLEYKVKSKKIVGKTVGKANVKIKVAGVTYTVKSNNKGIFKCKLKKKLKKRQTITVSVSKNNYSTKTSKFVVKRKK